MGAASDDEDDPQYRQIFERKLKAMVELSNLKGKRKKKKVEQIGKDISKI
jgi:primosomal protein N''